MSDLLKDKTKVAVVLGASLAAVVVWKFLQKKNHNSPPKKWKKVGEVSDLLCYPIKSCGWIRVAEVDCNIIGAQTEGISDRSFMVVNSKKEFLTARQHPKLVLIKPDINGDVLTLSAPGVETVVNVNITSLFSEIPIKAYVWEQEVEVADAGDEVAKWVSQLMLQEDEGLRLVFYLSSLPTRDVREKFKVFETVTPDDTGAFHDATSFMMINESSIDDLNTRVEKSVKPLQFRPNFVVKGPEPYEEDKWNWVRVGDAIFRNVKPCTRCVFTNIDPYTAVSDKAEEPLKTLRNYRRFKKTGESPVMGIQLALRQPGKVKLNDTVYVDDD